MKQVSNKKIIEEDMICWTISRLINNKIFRYKYCFTTKTPRRFVAFELRKIRMFFKLRSQ